ncbi:MAG: hypothetical protein E4H20_09510, partial [Spirochaetales bacterium]
MNKSSKIFFLMACALAIMTGSASAQAPARYKVAVVDAILPEGLDQAAISPVTEKAAETLLAMGAFDVLDRSYVDAILKEMEFQLSTLTDASKTAAAGTMLGADCLLVIKVDKLDGIFFLNAKLLETETGRVIAQSSESRETPKISALVEMVASATASLGSRVSGSVATTTAAAKPPRIGMVTGADLSTDTYERWAWTGLTHFAEAQGLKAGQDVVLIQAAAGDPFEKALAEYAATGPDLVLCAGFMYAP